MEENIANEGWQVADKASADWAIEQIAKARAEIKDNENTAKLIMERKRKEIDDWLTKQNERAESTIAFMSSKLEPWVRMELAKQNEGKKNPKFSLPPLPSGKLSFKKSSDEWTCGGAKCGATNDALLDIIGDDFIRVETKTTRSPQWSEFKKLLTVDGDNVIRTDTGEIVEGIKCKQGTYQLNVDC